MKITRNLHKTMYEKVFNGNFQQTKSIQKKKINIKIPNQKIKFNGNSTNKINLEEKTNIKITNQR